MYAMQIYDPEGKRLRTIDFSHLKDPALLAYDSYGQILITQPGSLVIVNTDRARDVDIAVSRLPTDLSISLSADRVDGREVISVVQRHGEVVYCKMTLDETA